MFLLTFRDDLRKKPVFTLAKQVLQSHILQEPGLLDSLRKHFFAPIKTFSSLCGVGYHALPGGRSEPAVPFGHIASSGMGCLNDPQFVLRAVLDQSELRVPGHLHHLLAFFSQLHIIVPCR